MKHTKETKIKISETLKNKKIIPPYWLSPCFKKGWNREVVFGEQKAKEIKEKILMGNLGIKRSKETRLKQSLLKRGNKHWNYIDGRSSLGYSFEFNKDLKESICKRDNYICQNCGITKEEHLIVIGSQLDVHHIDYDKKNNNENNLITLCKSCNVRANYNRDYWKKYYQKKMEIIYVKRVE